VQRDILNDLDTLINLNKQPPSGGADADPSQRNQPKNDQKASGGQRKSSQNQLTRNPNPGQGQKPGQGNQPQQSTAQSGTSNTGGAGSKSPVEENKLVDLYKDIWGHLPESMRGEMDAYSREAFMAKYSELIKQYYATVAEKSRQKER
jgi:hypothetical protein